jgi:hypothetical protein
VIRGVLRETGESGDRHLFQKASKMFDRESEGYNNRCLSPLFLSPLFPLFLALTSNGWK